MKLTLLIAALLGGLAWHTVSLTPNRADYGKTQVGGGVALKQFTVTRSDTAAAIVSIEGPYATEFLITGEHRGIPDTLEYCEDTNATTFTVVPCKVDTEFRPTSLGVKFATLVVTDHHGHRATAALQGEGVNAGCRAVHVPCNWDISYSGTIRISQVDSVLNDDRRVRYETVVDVSIILGRVQCTGQRNEIEQTVYKGVPENEMKAVLSISGPGMAAIEFQPDEAGKMTYVLTYACPTPEGKRESRSLRGGEVDVQKVESTPVDWRGSRQVAAPQPATEQGMSPLVGTWSDGTWDPDNKEGMFIKATWNLRKP